jgi:hypothetical protein
LVYTILPRPTLPANQRTGNDHDEDSDKEPEPPTKVVDKPIARTSKRNAPDAPPSESRGGAIGGDRGGRGGRRGGFSGNEDGSCLICSIWVTLALSIFKGFTSRAQADPGPSLP